MISSAVKLSSVLELDGVESHAWYANGMWQRIPGKLPEEQKLSIFVNGQELVNILCTPEKLNCLVAGFLRSEGFIADLGEILMMRICVEESLADVRLTKEIADRPPVRTITSGCGGGIAFDQSAHIRPLNSTLRVSPDQILSSVRLLLGRPEQGRENGEVRRGLHVSALSDGNELVIRSEDIGRHNTIDKIWGECMLTGTATTDRLLVTTGRISSEMLLKAARMEIPVVASLNSATRRAVELGYDLGITVVGYVRGGQMSVYSHPRHITGLPAKEQLT